MLRQRYFIRLATSGFENLINESVEPQHLRTFAKIFDPKDSEHSVYEIHDSAEETIIAAAHTLVRPRPKVELCTVFRILPSDLADLGIAVGPPQFGVTGIPWIDDRHRNLIVPSEKTFALVEKVVVHHFRGLGEDRLRRIPKALITACLKRFRDSTVCPTHVACIAEATIECRIGTCSFEERLVIDELNRIDLPEETVRPLAYLLNTGDHLSDWYSAVAELRRQHAHQYIQSLAQRKLLNSTLLGPASQGDIRHA